MKIKWYGHSAFRLTTTGGISMIIDPYEPGALGGVIRYDPITDPADVVLISHDHTDHNYAGGIKGPFRVIRKEGSYDIKGVRIRAM
jgi:L-ascorbate metabolism protein UlaG (beta-lactamase superfamily)